jgi:putative FmdB family regulatory protein
MPTYTYLCKSCDHVFDEAHRIAHRDDRLNEPCPECNEVTVIRVPVAYQSFSMDNPQPVSGDWKNLLQNIKKKNTTLTHKSTIGEQMSNE